MRIYISGPITGQKDYVQKFDRAERMIVAAGFEAVNPAKVNYYLPKSTTHEEYMRMSLMMMEMCEAVIFLEGWEQSKGARIEYEFARGKGYKMIFEGGIAW